MTEPVRGPEGNNGTESPIKNSRGKNLILFIMCFIGAFSIWIYAMQSDLTDYEQTFSSVKVGLINTSALESGTGLSVFSGADNVISLTLVGKKSEVTAITPDKITATADVSTISKVGTHAVTISVKIDGNASVKSMSKTQITVYVDRTSTVVIPVRVSLRVGMIPDAYEMGSAVPEQTTVAVSGPKSALDTISYARVTVDVGEVTTSFTSIGRLELFDVSDSVVNNPYIKTSASEMTVRVPVYAYKDVPLKVDYVHGFFTEEDVTVTVSPASVRIKGDPMTLSGIESLLVTKLDEKMIWDDFSSTFRLDLPDGVTGADSEEISATVSLHLLKNAIQEMTTSNFIVTGTSQPYDIKTDSLTISLRGPASQLRYLKSYPEILQVRINLADFSGTGKLTVPAEILINSENCSKVYELGSYTVLLELG